MLNIYFLNAINLLILLFLYSLKFSDLFLKLSLDTNYFFIINIGTSIFLGIILYKKLNIKFLEKKTDSDSRIKYNLIMITIFHMLEYIYMGKIPLVSILKKSGEDYLKFEGIPTIHTLLLTYTIYYCIKLFYYYLITKKKIVIVKFIYLFSFLILSGTRSTILLGFIPCIFLYLGTIKKTIKNICKILMVLCLTFYLFGVFGNIRHGKSIDDYSYIKIIGKSNEQFEKSIIPDVYFWTYIYVTSPLGNLEKNIQNKNRNGSSIIRDLIPDFIKKRIWTDNDEILLMTPALNVSTAYCEPYIHGGFLGMYFYYCFVNFYYYFLYIFLKKRENKAILTSIMSTIIVLNIFANMLTFSLLSFQLIYPLIDDIISRFKKIKNI